MQELKAFITQHNILSLAAILVIILILVVELLKARRRIYTVTTAETIDMINHENAQVIDIRSNEVYRQGHIINAQSIPSREIRDNPQKLDRFKGKPIIVVCDAGLESQKIAVLLFKRGHDSYSLAGGIQSWRRAEIPLVKE